MNRKLIFEIKEGDSEYVYFVEPQYDEDGVHMCYVFFRKNAFTDSDEYTKQEVTEGEYENEYF